MPFFRDPARTHQKKLERFRANFLHQTGDGTYPHHRQQRLYQWCQKAGLDWDEARQYVFPEARQFLHSVIDRVIDDGKITPTEIAGLRQLVRRIGLTKEAADPLAKLYDVIEHRINTMILERAAYLSSPVLITQIQSEIALYDLPTDRVARLHALLERQHDLAKLMAKQLPVIVPSVTLYKDELCHLDMPTIFIIVSPASKEETRGQLIATSQRLMFLSVAGGFTVPWEALQTIHPYPFGVGIETIDRRGVFSCEDPKYIATLFVAAQKLYAPSNRPQPKHPNKRLPSV